MRPKSKHTPGPWQVLNPHKATNYVIDTKPRKKDFQFNIADSAHNLADANLIAAAPDLLEALEEIVSEIIESGCSAYMNESSDFSKTFNKRLVAARAAITKARYGGE